ncbi:MAG: hypothetical protein COA82_09630 [Alkaliphilus sp.]|nr:MAG: hypothetical protein COA82_09630 [Alkaliphilus sp.]
MEKIQVKWAVLEDSEDLAIIHSKGWKAAYKGIIPDDLLDNIRIDKRRKIFERALTEKNEETCVLVVD